MSALRSARPPALASLTPCSAGNSLLRGDASKLQVAVDDKDVSALDARAVGKMVRGPVGTSVRIKVQKRDGTTPRAYDVTLRRAAPKVKLRLQPTPPLHRSLY